VRFVSRGDVDRAILRDLWERDVYGIGSVAAPPTVVVDIGAHIGAFSLLASELWPAARVIACEPDPENARLLRANLAGRPGAEIVEAAVVDGDGGEVAFHLVPDKAGRNSGGGSCVRPEPESIPTRVRALSARALWQSKAIGVCDLLKVDCEGAELAILRSLAAAGFLGNVRLIVGEWHAADARSATVERVCRDLAEVLDRTHNVELRGPVGGREGHFTARLRAVDTRTVD
jgi:FkbM family methyltransferase